MFIHLHIQLSWCFTYIYSNTITTFDFINITLLFLLLYWIFNSYQLGSYSIVWSKEYSYILKIFLTSYKIPLWYGITTVLTCSFGSSFSSSFWSLLIIHFMHAMLCLTHIIHKNCMLSSKIYLSEAVNSQWNSFSHLRSTYNYTQSVIVLHFSLYTKCLVRTTSNTYFQHC